jgi:hypothetical protein
MLECLGPKNGQGPSATSGEAADRRTRSQGSTYQHSNHSLSIITLGRVAPGAEGDRSREL